MPATSPSDSSIISALKPLLSLHRRYIRSSISAQSCASVPPAPDFKLNTPTLKKDERLYFSLLTMQPDGSTLLLEASPQVTPDLIPIRNQNRNQTLTRFLKVAILKVGLILQFQIHQSLSMLVHHLDQSVDLNGTLATEPLVPALPPNMSILNQALRLSISTAMTHQETSKLLLAQSQW